MTECRCLSFPGRAAAGAGAGLDAGLGAGGLSRHDPFSIIVAECGNLFIGRVIAAGAGVICFPTDLGAAGCHCIVVNEVVFEGFNRSCLGRTTADASAGLDAGLCACGLGRHDPFSIIVAECGNLLPFEPAAIGACPCLDAVFGAGRRAFDCPVAKAVLRALNVPCFRHGVQALELIGGVFIVENVPRKIALTAEKICIVFRLFPRVPCGVNIVIDTVYSDYVPSVGAAFQISTGYKAAADTRLRQHAGRKHRIAITYSCLVYHSSISCVFQLIIIIVQIFVVISDI